MTLPALQPLKYRPSCFDPVGRHLRLRRNLDRSRRLLRRKTRREVLYICHHVHLLLDGEWQPLWHIGIDQAATDCVVQIFVSGQSAGGCGAALELAESEVTRLRINPLGVLALAIPQIAVAAGAVPAVVRSGSAGMAGHAVDMALRSQPLIFVILRHLRGRKTRERESQSRA